jgi:hypothetical protein
LVVNQHPHSASVATKTVQFKHVLEVFLTKEVNYHLPEKKKTALPKNVKAFVHAFLSFFAIFISRPPQRCSTTSMESVLFHGMENA